MSWEPTKKIIYERPDGGCTVTSVAPGIRMVSGANGVTFPVPVPFYVIQAEVKRTGALVEWAETEDECLARVAVKDVPADATAVTMVPVEDLPERDEFRNAWRRSGAGVSVDLPAARAIAAEKVPGKVAAIQTAPDVAALRAIVRGES